MRRVLRPCRPAVALRTPTYTGASYTKADGTAVPDLWDTWFQAAEVQYDIASPDARDLAERFEQLPGEAPHAAAQRYDSIIGRLQKGAVSDRDLARWFFKGLQDLAMKTFNNSQFMVAGAPSWNLQSVRDHANHYYMCNQLSPLEKESPSASGARRTAPSSVSRVLSTGGDETIEHLRREVAELRSLNTRLSSNSFAAPSSASRPLQPQVTFAAPPSPYRGSAGQPPRGAPGGGRGILRNTFSDGGRYGSRDSGGRARGGGRTGPQDAHHRAWAPHGQPPAMHLPRLPGQPCEPQPRLLSPGTA